MRFTDYYAEASCTAGRASFITGEIPLRTGLTTVGQAGADVGMPAKACTIAAALKARGYATGQFGKNHLGDLNKYLPTLHGFDEFRGYLYHLDAMSDPYWYSFPNDAAYRDEYGPRNLVHSWATEEDDATEMPRWGKVGKQRIEDEGPLAPFPDMSNVANMHDITPKAKFDMTTFDEVLVKSSCDFMDKAKKEADALVAAAKDPIQKKLAKVAAEKLLKEADKKATAAKGEGYKLADQTEATGNQKANQWESSVNDKADQVELAAKNRTDEMIKQAKAKADAATK
jgi:arylsulfatase A-like enzyme